MDGNLNPIKSSGNQTADINNRASAPNATLVLTKSQNKTLSSMAGVGSTINTNTSTNKPSGVINVVPLSSTTTTNKPLLVVTNSSSSSSSSKIDNSTINDLGKVKSSRVEAASPMVARVAQQNQLQAPMAPTQPGLSQPMVAPQVGQQQSQNQQQVVPPMVSPANQPGQVFQPSRRFEEERRRPAGPFGMF